MKSMQPPAPRAGRPDEEPAAAWRRVAAALAAISVAWLLGACSTAGLLLSATGIATDTSPTWDVVKHLHAKLTEGELPPCGALDSVQRALSVRCGAFVAGSLRQRDIANADLGTCPLAIAVRDPRLWPVLPELLDRGAQPEACRRSPLVDLAQADACPDFAAATPAVRDALGWLAQVDARAIHHDVFRMLSCPQARAVGLDRVLGGWLAAGQLQPGTLGFSPLGALHPSALTSRFALELEASGHTAQAALGGYDGRLAPGFEEALRSSDWAALDWWLARAPELADRVPPMRGNQLPWLPLARVLIPNFLTDAESRPAMVGYLLAHGANPWRRLPADADRSVVAYARSLQSPLLALLDPPPGAPTEAQPVAEFRVTRK